MASYVFRPLVHADRPLFDAWLSQPHIGGWWSDADTEWALVEEELDIEPAKRGADMRIVETAAAVPFAFIQDYDAHHWEMPQYADMPEGTRAIDTFLGDPAYLGQGHAKAYLQLRSDQLLDHYPMVVVDPDPQNTHAIRAYAAAGFVERRICPSEDGDPVLVMTRHH